MNLKKTKKPKQWGFALIVTLSMMVLLTVVAVGLLSLSVVSLRSSNQGTARSEAQANARLALRIALAELQKTMGPDMRISARAGTLTQHPKVGASVAPDSPKAWWVGASHSDPDLKIGINGQPVVWLISGLDPEIAVEEQIQQSFENPVPMYGENTIDTGRFTGGQPIEAGRVIIKDSEGRDTGGFAYFIDDNGMKAQLTASNLKVRNDLAIPAGGGVLPGIYDLSTLEGMRGLAGVNIADYGKLGSINDLRLIGTDASVSKAKRLGYTTRSRGVLSDVRKGGLKKDLTIAFENDQVFTAVFGNNSSGFAEKYIVMDSEKFKQSSDIQANGYIHWEMFKDFYNIKKHIGTEGGMDYLDSSLFSKNDIFSGANTPFKLGQLGPHDIGANSDVPTRHHQLPYGEIDFIDPPSNTQQYRHNPITPVLASMHQNAWTELLPPLGPDDKQRIRTHVQLWKSQYNPYNIGLRVIGDLVKSGPRIMHYPQVYFTLEEGGSTLRYLNANGTQQSFSKKAGLSGKLQTSVPYSVMLGPGRAHVSAFKADGAIGKDRDSQNYDDKVRDLTLESIYQDYELASGLTGNVDLTIDFVLERQSMLHGANSNGFNASHEVAQAMWAPFAYEKIGSSPGKKIAKTGVLPSELNENTMASFAFKLRSTLEGSSSVRPLIDSNIRAMLLNTRWDSPLGLDCLAAYSPEDQGVVQEQIPQMLTVDAPKGYTYWGAGDDPADGYDRVILFDIPREDLISLGQFQHAGVGRFSYEPTYIVGNSYANLRIPQKEWKTSISDTFSTDARGLANYSIPGNFNLYDASYLVNEELFDSYIFTTIPQVADNYSNTSEDPVPSTAYFEAVLAGEKLLPNPRFLPYEPTGSTFDHDTLKETSSSGSETGAFYHNAGHLLVDGAFNVNSISVDAWEAFLSGTHELPYQKMDANGLISGFSPVDEVKGVRFPRVKSVFGEGMETDSLDENFWVGFRDLKQTEVRALAVAMVDEVKKRGPFLTLGEFINRKLESGELGERGALQAALDRTVNEGLVGGFEKDASHGDVPDDSSQGAGFPGQLLQGDVLQALSPYMTVRSDTFTIRAYGESRNQKTGQMRARAWCEATVQRYPDPVEDSSSNASSLAELVTPSSEFGRSFRITSFRWLSPDEI